MSDIYDILETSLQELEQGADIEYILEKYPTHARELRPMLKSATRARSIAAPSPSSEMMRRGRARLLQQAAEMRESKIAPRKFAMSLFQRFAVALTTLTILLGSGTGLVRASSTALPGENLYPVKRTWEDVNLFFAFNTEERETLENEYEQERLDEVNELLAGNRQAEINFAGMVTETNGQFYVSGVPVIAAPGMLQNGDLVMVTGQTNANGFVTIQSVQTLPPGSIVPLGESEDDEND